MKTSKYNLFIPYEGEDFILYNVLNRSVLLIGKELKQALEEDNIARIPQELRLMAYKNGALVDDDTDELQIVKVQYWEEKFSYDHLQFIILPTYACNLRCIYCYQRSAPHLKGTMNDKTCEQVVKFIIKETHGRRPNSVGIGFFGGEPLTVETKVFQIWDSVLERLPSKVEKDVGIITNATLITEETIKRIERLKCSGAQVRIFTTLAGERKLHDSRRIDAKGRGTYDRVLNAVRMLSNTATPVSIRIDLDNSTIDCIDRLIADLEENGLRESVMIRLGKINLEFCLSEFHPQGIASLDSLSPIAEVADRFAQRGFVVMEIEPFKPIPNWCSQQTAYTYTIDPEGDLYSCYDALIYPEHKIGSIDEDGNAKFNTQYYKWYSRDPFVIKECRECKLLPICLGGCAFLAWSKHQTFDAPGCYEGFKELIKRSVKRQVIYGMMDEKAKLRLAHHEDQEQCMDCTTE